MKSSLCNTPNSRADGISPSKDKENFYQSNQFRPILTVKKTLKSSLSSPASHSKSLGPIAHHLAPGLSPSKQPAAVFSCLQWLSVASSGAAVVFLVGSLPTHTHVAGNCRPLGPLSFIFYSGGSLRALPSACPSPLSVRRRLLLLVCVSCISASLPSSCSSVSRCPCLCLDPSPLAL